MYWAYYIGHGVKSEEFKMFSGLTNQVSSWMGSSKSEHPDENKEPNPPVDEGNVNVTAEKKEIR